MPNDDVNLAREIWNYLKLDHNVEKVRFMFFLIIFIFRRFKYRQILRKLYSNLSVAFTRTSTTLSVIREITHIKDV